MENDCLDPIGDLTQLRREYERCWPWLWESLCEFGPTHNKEQLWLRLASRKAFLWPGKSCAIVGEIIVYPIGLHCFNYWLQGGQLSELLTLHHGIEAWAKTRGCHQAVGYGRAGWQRVMAGDWRQGRTERTKFL